MTRPSYDLYLGDISSLSGYRVRSLRRDSAPLVASRFSSGQQGLSDLDLLKSAALVDTSEGMFQRSHESDRKAARLVGVYNKYDEQLYPAPPRSTALSSPPFGMPRAKAENSQYTFGSFSYFSTGNNTNYLYKAAAGNTNMTSIALPAAVANGGSGATGQITGLCLHGEYLYIGLYDNSYQQDSYRMKISDNTFQNITGYITLFFELRGALYGIQKNGDLFAITNEFAAGACTYTQLDKVGLSTLPAAVEEFNGAAWIAKPEGLFRFDGFKSVKVLPYQISHMKAFNGALFFVSGNWLFRFDGSNVVKLQYMPETFSGFSASSDYLFLATHAAVNTYQVTDKFGTYTATDQLRRIYTYDGASFYLLNETTLANPTVAYSQIYYTNSILFDYCHPTSGAELHSYAMSTIFSATSVTASSSLEITTSEFDDNFPNVYKTLELVEPIYTGFTSGDSIAVRYQTFNGTTWSSWNTAGTITTAANSQLELTDNSLKLFKRMKISVIVTPAAGSSIALRGVSWRHTLQPRTRWRWTANLMASGNSTSLDRNDNAITADSNALTNQVISTIKRKTPVFLLAPDYGRVKTGISAAALTFIVKGQAPIYTDPYSEYSLCAVQNSNSVWEVLRVSSVSYSSVNDETTITVLERGYYGVTAATINASAEFRLAYRVYVTRLQGETPILDETVYNEQDTTGESQIQREFLLEIVEV